MRCSFTEYANHGSKTSTILMRGCALVRFSSWDSSVVFFASSMAILLSIKLGKQQYFTLHHTCVLAAPIARCSPKIGIRFLLQNMYYIICKALMCQPNDIYLFLHFTVDFCISLIRYSLVMPFVKWYFRKNDSPIQTTINMLNVLPEMAKAMAIVAMVWASLQNVGLSTFRQI